MIILLGLAGSGKSTQGQLLAEKKGWQWLSAGQVLRDTGIEAEKVNKGELVEDEVIEELLIPEAEKYENEGVRVVLDGFPRDENQARGLVGNEALLGQVERVIYLEVPLSELRERLLARGREDDTPEVIERRLADAEQIICSILPLFEEKKVPVLRVDGTGTVEEVNEKLMTKIKELK